MATEQCPNIDPYTLAIYQHKQLLSKLACMVSNYTIPQDLTALREQHEKIDALYQNLLRDGGDKRRHHRGSREERLPNGCYLRQRLSLPNNEGYHDKILYKVNGTYICDATRRFHKTLNQATADHYVECGKVWNADDEKINPRHKEGKAKNAVSAWGNGKNSQAFYALRAGTEDQYNVSIIDINDDEWYKRNISTIEVRLGQESNYANLVLALAEKDEEAAAAAVVGA